jgi:hypothetical protein
VHYPADRLATLPERLRVALVAAEAKGVNVERQRQAVGRTLDEIEVKLDKAERRNGNTNGRVR